MKSSIIATVCLVCLLQMVESLPPGLRGERLAMSRGTVGKSQMFHQPSGGFQATGGRSPSLFYLRKNFDRNRNRKNRSRNSMSGFISGSSPPEQNNAKLIPYLYRSRILLERPL